MPVTKQQWIQEQIEFYHRKTDLFPSYTLHEKGLVLQHRFGFSVERCWDETFHETSKEICSDCTYHVTYWTKQPGRIAHELVFELEKRWLFLVFSCEKDGIFIYSFIQNSKEATFNYPFEKAVKEGLLPEDFVQNVREKQKFFSDYFMKLPKHRLKMLTSKIHT